jgi:hypothetical protein
MLTLSLKMYGKDDLWAGLFGQMVGLSGYGIQARTLGYLGSQYQDAANNGQGLSANAAQNALYSSLARQYSLQYGLTNARGDLSQLYISNESRTYDVHPPRITRFRGSKYASGSGKTFGDPLRTTD